MRYFKVCTFLVIFSICILTGFPIFSQVLVIKTPPLTIDGNLTDWPVDAQFFDMSYGVAPLSWGAPLDWNINSKLYLAWDDTYFYFAYTTTDTHLWLDGDPTEGVDDSVEVYFDRNHAPGVQAWTTEFYLFKLNLANSWGGGRGTAPVSAPAFTFDAAWRPANKLAANSYVGTLNNNGDTDTSYIIEARVSWSDLNGAPSVGKKEGLGTATPDDDDGGGNDAGTYNYNLFDLTTFPEIEYANDLDVNDWLLY